jgi:hypothetical protein
MFELNFEILAVKFTRPMAQKLGIKNEIKFLQMRTKQNKTKQKIDLYRVQCQVSGRAVGVSLNKQSATN